MKTMTEAQLQAAVIDLAHIHGMLIHHDRPARTTHGWRTAIEGHKGFPDIVLVGTRATLYRELKNDTRRLDDAQIVWLERLTASGCDAGVWRPHDLHPAGGRIAAEIRAAA